MLVNSKDAPETKVTSSGLKSARHLDAMYARQQQKEIHKNFQSWDMLK